MSEISNNNFKPLIFKTIEGLSFFDYDDIINLKADRNYTYVFIVNQEKPLKVIGNLNSLNKILPKGIFFRCHRSHIVNLKHIGELKHKSKILVMKNDKTIPLSAASEKELLQIIHGKNKNH